MISIWTNVRKRPHALVGNGHSCVHSGLPWVHSGHSGKPLRTFEVRARVLKDSILSKQ